MTFHSLSVAFLSSQCGGCISIFASSAASFGARFLILGQILSQGARFFLEIHSRCTSHYTQRFITLFTQCVCHHVIRYSAVTICPCSVLFSKGDTLLIRVQLSQVSSVHNRCSYSIFPQLLEETGYEKRQTSMIKTTVLQFMLEVP